MKKILIVAITVVAIVIILSSCSYETCATYSRTPLKVYGIQQPAKTLKKI